jgi:hypothetical protein
MALFNNVVNKKSAFSVVTVLYFTHEVSVDYNEEQYNVNLCIKLTKERGK